MILLWIDAFHEMCFEWPLKTTRDFLLPIFDNDTKKTSIDDTDDTMTGDVCLLMVILSGLLYFNQIFALGENFSVFSF